MKTVSRSLFIFAFLFFFYIGNEISGYSFIYQVALFSPCFFLLGIARKKTEIYYSKFLFLILYTLGYPVYLAVMYLTIDEYTAGGWMGIGNFSFEPEQLNELSLASMAMMFGILAGIGIFNHAGNRTKLFQKNEIYEVNINRLKNYITYWFFASMGLIVFMASLGLGRTGLQDSTVLPFGIKGILLYFRYILVPLLGMYLLGKSIEANENNLKNRTLLYLFIIAISIALTALSRSDLVLVLGPALLFIVTHEDPKVAKNGKVLFFQVLFVVIVGTQVVQIYRNMAYTSEGTAGIGFSEIIDILKAVDLQVMANNLLSLITLRQGGARDMAVALNSPYQSVTYIWDFFWQINEQDFMIDVWGFDLEAFDQEGKSYGTGFNGFGWYGFGRSLTIIFLLSLITGCFAGWMESIFLKLRVQGAQIFIAFYITLALWNSFVWGRFWRIIPIVLIGCYIIKKLNLKLRAKRSVLIKNEN